MNECSECRRFNIKSDGAAITAFILVSQFSAAVITNWMWSVIASHFVSPQVKKCSAFYQRHFIKANATSVLNLSFFVRLSHCFDYKRHLWSHCTGFSVDRDACLLAARAKNFKNMDSLYTPRKSVSLFWVRPFGMINEANTKGFVSDSSGK